MGVTLKGIDVLKYQNNIDFDKVKASGNVDFAIIRIGHLSGYIEKDATFERNYAGFKRVGIPVGAYFYVGPLCKSYNDGVADALRVLDMIKGKQFEYPIYIDFEKPDATNKTGNTDACIGFCETLEKNNYFTGIYALDLSGFKERLDINRLAPYALWVARYGSKPTYVKNYGIWQYSSTLPVPGITDYRGKACNVDHNYCYVDYASIIKSGGFNGFGKTQPTPEPTPEPAPEPTPEPTLKSIKILNMTDGDLNTFINMADQLGLQYTLE